MSGPAWSRPAPRGRARRRVLHAGALGLAVVVALVSSRDCGAEGGADHPASDPTYVGRSACAPCHPSESERWRGSAHDRALQEPTPETVKGDFADASFTYAGVTSTFSKRDGKFIVRTDGPDGALHDYVVAYTIGVDPLQQYLVRFPDGRMQALSICWDTRPKEQGGQRWFHLHPGEKITHDDLLHWTGPYQNWNHMCAECHSTNLQKGYRADGDSFATSWSEIDVSCEACHGPASRHVAWAKAGSTGLAGAGSGLVVPLRDADGAAWVPDAQTGIARRSRPRRSHVEVETCAVCHSLRSPITDARRPGQPLLQAYDPTLPLFPFYEDDGQIREEVYEYGSFLQSKMYAAGVTCSDCHDPHGLKVAGGNATCARCHLPARFDTPAHHHHETGSSGASCVSCHMPSKTYMVVDERHDHGFRIPRPDLSVKLGTPNTCTQCHTTHDARWAADAATRWWGGTRARTPHYGEALHAARLDLAGKDAGLAALAADQRAPAIVRAAGLALAAGSASPATLERAVADPDAIVRAAVPAALRNTDPSASRDLVARLLTDPVRDVRIQAARFLAAVPQERLTVAQSAARDSALAEYRAAQAVNADRAEAHLDLAGLAVELGHPDDAEREYRAALHASPHLPVSYVDFADLRRLQQRDDDGEKILREGLRQAGPDPALLHSLGLLLVRQRRPDEALLQLERASALAPDNARYAYVYGVALQSTGKLDQARTVLAQAHERHTGDRDILAALVAFSRQAGDEAGERLYARKLGEVTSGASGGPAAEAAPGTAAGKR